MPLGFNPIGSGSFAASASSLLTVAPEAPSIVSVVVSPAGLSLPGGATKLFTVLVNGLGNYSTAVTWTASAGYINAYGLLVLPAATDVMQTIVVTAESVQDPTIKGSVFVQVLPIGSIDVTSIVVPDTRILRTDAQNWKIREGYTHTDSETYYLSQGYWTINKDVDDVLFYAIDIQPYLISINSSIAKVDGFPRGISMLMGPFSRDGLIIVKVGGGDPSDSVDAVNCLTFRIVCSNGENFDRTIYFALREN